MNLYKSFQCRVQLVWEKKKREFYVINQPSHVYTLVKDELIKKDREIFLSILLTARNTVIGIETVSMGTMNCSLVTPRELFKSALLANAFSIIICHNHPSGDMEPSNEDITITEQIVEAGKLLNIEVLDHLIISEKGFISLKEMNRLQMNRFTKSGKSILSTFNYKKI
jgi:DNA repair protein RadC